MKFLSRGTCRECWAMRDLDEPEPKGLCERCHLRIQQAKEELMPLTEEDKERAHNYQMYRLIILGAVAIMTLLVAGCWITNEWNLRSIRAVGGKVEQRYGPHAEPAIKMFTPELKAVPVPKEEGKP